MRFKLTAVSLGLLALTVYAAMPAVASATNKPLVVENGTAVAAGTKFTATNVGIVKTTTSLGTDECTTLIMTGTLIKNITGTVEANITSVVEGGTGAPQPGAPHPECTTKAIFGGDTTITPNTATNGLPWCLQATGSMKTDEFQIRGNECAKAARAIRVAKDITGIGTCTYERSAAEPIPGTFTTSTTDSVLSISEVNFPAVSGNPFGCPGSFKWDLSFTMETDVSPSTSLGITE